MLKTRRPFTFWEAAAGGWVVLALVTAGFFAVTHAEEPAKPEQQQQQKKDATDAATEALKAAPAPETKVSERAKPLVDKMRVAYAKLPGLQMSGTWSAEWDVDGDKGKESAEFTGSYAAPNKYRHETKNDLLFGSTGEKLYAFTRDRYVQEDAPKARGGVGDLPKGAGSMLKEKNPSLLLAVADTADGSPPYFAESATAVDKGDDVTIDGKSFPSLNVSTNHGADVRVLVDPATGLMRQWSVDLKRSLQERGRQNVNAATLTIDYKDVKAEAPADANAFAWAPPEGARDAATMTGDDKFAAKQLTGKPAPAFELEGLDGKKVKLADFKGSVVVLDFWATWCGPCLIGMPVVEKAANARKDKGVKVYAVNVEEDKATVEPFIKQHKIGLNVLLDPSGATSRAYSADEVVPLTIVIGKDGVVKDVLVGVHEEGDLLKAFDAALKG